MTDPKNIPTHKASSRPPQRVRQRPHIDLGDTRSEGFGEWLYGHRVGLIAVIACFMLGGIFIATARVEVVVQPIEYIIEFVDAEPTPEEVEKLKGVDTLVVNALRFRPHDSHFSVEEALDLIAKVKPRKAYLTHMSHEIGLHADSLGKLPQGVELAYDGLTIEIED